jgi:hypothetical protein
MRINRPERRTADLSTSLRPEESWACGPRQGMKKLFVQRPLSQGSVALLFVIPSAAEGSAVPRTFPGNTESRSATNLSSRPERTRISCHAALDKAACASFFKERRMMLANATNSYRKSGVAEWRDLRFPAISVCEEKAGRTYGP